MHACFVAAVFGWVSIAGSLTWDRAEMAAQQIYFADFELLFDATSYTSAFTLDSSISQNMPRIRKSQ